MFIEYFIKRIVKERKTLKFYHTLVVTFIETVTCVDKNDPDVKVEKDDFGVKKKKKRAHFHSKALLTTNRLGLKQIVNLTIQQIIKKDWTMDI